MFPLSLDNHCYCEFQGNFILDLDDEFDEKPENKKNLKTSRMKKQNNVLYMDGFAYFTNREAVLKNTLGHVR